LLKWLCSRYGDEKSAELAGTFSFASTSKSLRLNKPATFFMSLLLHRRKEFAMRVSIPGISPFVSVFVFASLAAGLSAACAAEIPIKRIVLYTACGFFERDGIVAAGQQALLGFETADMNDVLKSLTVTDATGHRISAIRFDANETVGGLFRKCGCGGATAHGASRQW
jgi:hypothetical protein